MKETIKKAKSGWKVIAWILGTITLVFSVFQAYDHFRTPDISGEWRLTFIVEESSYHAYVGDTHGYKAYFTQSDKNINGHGEKWEYRGKPLDYDNHTKIEFEGSLVRGSLKANYVLHGSSRETTGIIEVEITDGGKKMTGTFAGTAADTKGTVTGEKQE